MNHIYKTIFNKRTGGISVVSKNANNHSFSKKYQIHQLHAQSSFQKTLISKVFIKKNLSTVISLLLGCIANGTSYATEYTGHETLMTSNQVNGGFNLFIGDDYGTKQGYVVQENSLPIESGTKLIVDYSNSATNLQFIVAGYGYPNKDSSDNYIVLKESHVNGPIFAGLAQQTNIISCANTGRTCSLYRGNYSKKSSGNTVEVLDSDYNEILGDISAGYAEYSSTATSLTNHSVNSVVSEMYVTGEFIANNNKVIVNGEYNNTDPNTNININAGVAKLYRKSADLYSIATANVAYINDTKSTTDNNEIVINGTVNKFTSLNAGYSALNTIGGERIGTSNLDRDSYNQTQIYMAGSEANANNNKIKINGDGSKVLNIASGKAIFNIFYGDAQYQSTHSDNNTSTGQHKGVYVNANNNSFTVKGNKNIFDEINIGDAQFNSGFGKANGKGNILYWEANQFNSNNNNFHSTGTSNNLGIIKVGQFVLNSTFDDVDSVGFNSIAPNAILGMSFLGSDINTNENIVEISGEDTKLNSLNVGELNFNIETNNILAGIYTDQNNNVIKGDAFLSIELKDVSLKSNNNSINLNGRSTISGDIITGKIDFNISHGVISGENGTDIKPLIYTNSNFSPSLYSDNGVNINGTKAFANHNIITIDGTHTFIQGDVQDPTDPTKTIKEYGSIYGGYLNYNKDQQYFLANADGTASNVQTFVHPESYDVFTGNTLNYNNRAPITLKEIGNFQNYNFIIDSEIDDPNTPFITADTIILGSHESNMSDTSKGLKSDIYVTEIAGDKEIINNTKYILMQATNNLIENSHGTHLVESVSQQGLSRVYDVDTYIEGNNVVAVIEGGPEDNGVETNPQLDALLLGNLSGLMLLTRNADTLSDNLFNAISEQNYQRGLTPFIITSGNHTKYETGHHSNIKSDGALTTIGLSWQDEQTTLGTFVENGWDSYTTFNGFTDVTNVSGKGHNRFNGIGLYGHYDFMNGWYADATVRGGRLHTAFETDDLRKVETNERAEYKLSTNYYGANLEGGYSITFNPKNTVNLKAKYLWAQTNSQDLTVASEQIHFNKLDSHRVQFHIENLNQFTPELTFISSLGYEHEFTGKAQGHASSFGFFEIEDQSVKGGTGISSIGLRYIPSQYKNLSLDVKATGYIGKREGGMGMLKVDYTF